MDQKQYQELRKSLVEGEKKICIDGVEICVRNCRDRKEGYLDPRTEAAARLTRQDFESHPETIDPELLRNQDKLLGMSNPDGHSLLEQMRYQFGWRTMDRSKGILTRSVKAETEEYIGIRWIYTPESGRKEKPCFIFIHGGGFFGGDTMTVESQCKHLAELADAVVVSVDYPLSPEAKYPAAFHMCYDTLTWAHEHARELGIARDAIAVAGDSAGGTLSAAVVLRDRAEGNHYISYAGLIYPSVIWEYGKSMEYRDLWKEELYDNRGNDAFIKDQISLIGRTKENVKKWYLKEGENTDSPYINPISGELKGFPKTLIMTAEYDFLRPECELFTRMLRKQGVDVRHIRYGGIVHGTFDRLGYAPQVEDMLAEMANDINFL